MSLLIGRMRVALTGFSGSPGVNTFYFFGSSPTSFTATDAANARVALETFYTACKSLYVNSTSILCDTSMDTIDVVTGVVQGSVSAGTATPIAGSGGLGAAPRAGALCISWNTGQPIGRRILRGRTFMSPTSSGAWGNDGSLMQSVQGTVQNAANALIATANADLAIWHRPVPVKTGNNGQAVSAVSAKINNKGAVLRSRRD